MKNEISELLSNISQEEFERFGDFIRSPYFNKLPRLIKLYDYIKDNFAGIEKGSITREGISAFMYPKEAFKNESIRKLLSDFWKLLERFMAQEEFEKNEWDKNIYTLRGLRTRHYDDKFFQRLKEFKKEHKNSNQEIDEFYETNTKLISEEYEYWYFSKFDSNNEINQEKSDGLDYEFIAKKLFLFQYMLSREYVNIDLKYTYSFFQEINEYIEKNKKKITQDNSELYRNYLGTKFLYFKGDSKVLSEMKNFIDGQNYLKRKIAKPYWDYINACAYLINKGDVKYYTDAFEYLKILDLNNIIESGEEVIHYYLKTAVDIAIFLQEYNWLENFIKKYENKIKHNFRQDMINLSYSKLFLAKNDFKKSKDFADKISFRDYLHYIGAKKILARIAYEEDDLDKIISINDAARKFFVSHEEIPKVYRISAIGYFEKIIQLSKLKEKFSLNEKIDFEINDFRKNLEGNKDDISFKEWFLEKVNKIK